MPDRSNKGTLTRFFSGEYQNLVRYAKRKLDEIARQEAEDIVQDVALSLFDKADISAPIENLSAYVYHALRNRLIDYFRKKKEIVSLDEPIPHTDDLKLSDVIYSAQYNTASETEKMQIAQDLYKLLDSLREDERAIIIATEIEGKTFSELSEKWGAPINTLLSKKFRSLAKIKKHAKFIKE